VSAPEATIVLVSPAQINAGVAVVVMFGNGATNTFTMVVELQVPIDPVTVNEVVVLGVTTAVDPTIAPGFQVKEVAPAALRVALLPKQTTVGVVVALIVGVGVTNTGRTAEFVQPAALAPITVKLVEEVGATVTEDPTRFPGFQVNDVAPLAVNVALLPLQISVGLTATVSVGTGFTTMLKVATLVHAFELVPVAVNVVVTEGVTTTLVPVRLPGFHVNVVAPDPLNVAEAPAQIALGVLLKDNVGRGLTITLTVCVEEHAPLLPVTMNTVDTLGLTIVVAEVIFPGFQVNEDAPAAVNVVLEPLQIFVGDAEATSVGVGVTSKFVVVLEVHPAALVPITVKMVELAGVTVTVAPLKFPGFQVKDAAPLAVKVAVLPLQIDVGELLAIIVGVGFTITLTVRVDEQTPFAPVTVNTVDTLGLTIVVAEVIFPGFQVNEDAPAAVNVVLAPLQIFVGDADAITVGVGVTRRLVVTLAVQPAALVPVTVKIVELIGDTVTEAPLKFPGFHVKLMAPEAFNVAVEPLQIAVGLAFAVIVGVIFTITVTAEVEVQAPFIVVAVNVVVTEGVTTIVVPVILPGFHVKLGAPAAVKVEDAPEQMAVGEAIAVMLGGVSTVTVTTAELVQPAAEVPFTVNEVVVDSVVLTVAPIKFPGFQV
jgi:hypothetical protein